MANPEFERPNPESEQRQMALNTAFNLIRPLAKSGSNLSLEEDLHSLMNHLDHSEFPPKAEDTITEHFTSSEKMVSRFYFHQPTEINNPKRLSNETITDSKGNKTTSYFYYDHNLECILETVVENNQVIEVLGYTFDPEEDMGTGLNQDWNSKTRQSEAFLRISYPQPKEIVSILNRRKQKITSREQTVEALYTSEIPGAQGTAVQTEVYRRIEGEWKHLKTEAEITYADGSLLQIKKQNNQVILTEHQSQDAGVNNHVLQPKTDPDMGSLLFNLSIDQKYLETLLKKQLLFSAQLSREPYVILQFSFPKDHVDKIYPDVYEISDFERRNIPRDSRGIDIFLQEDLVYLGLYQIENPKHDSDPINDCLLMGFDEDTKLTAYSFMSFDAFPVRAENDFEAISQLHAHSQPHIDAFNGRFDGDNQSN